jgi:hypothetical protein
MSDMTHYKELVHISLNPHSPESRAPLSVTAIFSLYMQDNVMSALRMRKYFLLSATDSSLSLDGFLWLHSPYYSEYTPQIMLQQQENAAVCKGFKGIRTVSGLQHVFSKSPAKSFSQLLKETHASHLAYHVFRLVA